MKNNFTILLTLVILPLFFSIPTTINAQQENPFQYVSPKPNSVMVSNETNIIFKYSDDLRESSVRQELIRVVGSKSGSHTGAFLLSDDGRTIVFNPYQFFAYDEVVTVTVQRGIKSFANNEIPAYSFSFKTETEGIVQLSNGAFGEELIPIRNYDNLTKDNSILNTLPPPPITIDSLNNPGPGYIFMATWDRNDPHIYGNFIFILDSTGNIVDSVRVNGAPYDFKIQPNGLLSYALGNFAGSVPLPGEELQHMVLDSTFAVVDSFKMKNGYSTDFHEFLMLPNGHAMMMSYHTIIYDMSQIVPGGQTDASLVINIIQEQDLDRNVVFEWRNIDYIPIIESDLDLTASRINYGTLNGFDIDNDGNILASFRNHSEIMKINRGTGELIWRMGSPRGEFTFVGEHEENAPYYFARQHNISRLDNGNISLFDNGQFHVPPYSRAVEYAIDEDNKVATLVDEFRYPNGNIFTATAGNAQRLPGGGWFIGYGVPHPQHVKRNAVEVHPDGSIALELSLPNNVLAYRTYKLPWKELIKRPSVTHFEVLEGQTYSFNDASNITGVTITYIELTGYYYNLVTITRLPAGPVQAEFNDDVYTVYPVSIIYEGGAISSQTAEVHIDLSVYPEIIHPTRTSLFIRQFPNQGVFTMVPTVYDSSSNELIATINSFGEIVFGETGDVYTANPPILFEPLNSQKVLSGDSLALRWTGKGFYDLFQIQVSTDSTFTTTAIDSTMNLSFMVIGGLTNHTRYFWRVRSMLGVDISDWSPVWSFDVTDAFVDMVTPNGGEAWSMGSSKVIRWETNIADSVKLDLLYQQQVILTIDTTRSNPGAYEWLIPTNLNPDSTYKIIIVSIVDSSVIDTSNAVFSLTPPSGIETEPAELPNAYNLFQNYPNPFNPSTSIEFQIPESGVVLLHVYDILGNEIITLVNSEKPAGKYKVTFDASSISSGIYFYTLSVNSYISTKKMILMR